MMFVRMKIFLLINGILNIAVGANHVSEKPPYCYSGEQSVTMAWKCDQQTSKCARVRAKDSENDELCLTSLNVCKVLCDPYASLWPLPTGNVSVHKDLVVFMEDFIVFSNFSDNHNKKLDNLLQGLETYFLDTINLLSSTKKGTSKRESSADSRIRVILEGKELISIAKIGDKHRDADPAVHHTFSGVSRGGKNTTIILYLVLADRITTALTYNTSESYILKIDKGHNKTVNVTIEAQTFFGARHGIETLLQLFVYDEISNSYLVPSQAYITDEPVYKHRGILLDTSRNYYPVDMITRLLDGMAYNKLNVFHWHLTDTHSFPYVSTQHSEMAAYGAYGPMQVYTSTDIKLVVEYARSRGIKVVPELDAPTHVGEGWQYFEEDVLLCFKKEPWTSYCYEPPCGFLNPINERAYKILGDLYSEWNELFDSDMFHMGGDEMMFSCWNETQSIVDWLHARNQSRDDAAFLDLWAMFQKRAVETYDKVVKAAKKPRIILWTSDLTKNAKVKEFLDPDRYIIQVWCSGNDPQVIDLLNNGYKVIISNVDVLYLDLGFGNWLRPCSHSNCSTYSGWQTIYMNDPIRLVQNLNKSRLITSADYRSQILGAEATLWSEISDDRSMESRMWPRAAAHAERTWTNPTTPWQEATTRLLRQRERMNARNIYSQVLQPLWCHQNDGFCHS